jgi:GTPase
MLAKVTIIGRPNVWKSSFFNMFVGHKIAIVADEAGTTRDISEYEYTDKDNKLTYILSDSGWLDFSSKTDEIAKDIVERTKESIEESDILIWLLEYDKFTDLDEKILKIIRESKVKEVIVVANKADNDDMKMEAFSLPIVSVFPNFFTASVSHNSWFIDIRKFIADILLSKWLSYFVEEDVEWDFIKMSLVWRPNVWKSSLINAIVWKNRVMVKDMAWTTRDSIDTKFTFDNNEFILIDTAWIRRLSKVGTRNIENWSVMRTQRAITRSDIVWVVIDWIDWIHTQDLSIISSVLEENKWLIVIVNKWDKVLEKQNVDKDKIMLQYIWYLKEKFDFLPWVTVIFTSAVDKRRIEDILSTAITIKWERFKRVKTWIFNTFLEQVTYKHAPTWNRKAHKPKIYYWSQVDVNPPKFVLTVNNPEHFHFTYKRYLENRIRDNFWFAWTPIVIEFKW